jgi:hypothetical protein
MRDQASECVGLRHTLCVAVSAMAIVDVPQRFSRKWVNDHVPGIDSTDFPCHVPRGGHARLERRRAARARRAVGRLTRARPSAGLGALVPSESRTEAMAHVRSTSVFSTTASTTSPAMSSCCW